MSPLWMGEDEKPSRAVVDYGPAATLVRLRDLFPEGRFTKQADGTPVLVAHSKALAGCHVYEQAPGRLLGVFYVGSPRRWVNRLGDLVERHLEGDGEGILHVRWCPEAARRLRAFSRGRRPRMPTGTRFAPRLDVENGPKDNARPPAAPSTPRDTADAPGAPGGAP